MESLLLHPKQRSFLRSIPVLLAILLASLALVGLAYAQTPTVNAVLFYSPSCPHCQQVISQDLPPLFQKYGEQLNILGVDVSVREGQQLYRSAVTRFNIPEERIGVPCLVVGNQVLVGSLEIPEQFPGIIEQGLAANGVDWPDIPGLSEILVSQELTAPENLSMLERFSLDPAGNTLSVIVLLVMLVSLAGSLIALLRLPRKNAGTWPDWVIPLLTLVGLSVAGYLSYIELTQSQAICGPVGDCNRVQQSPYATLFGVLPIGVLGLVGYLLVGILWLAQRLGPETWQKPAKLSLWWIGLLGVLFSIYLTFLEPFVIGATCAWCITSALVMTLIFLAATGPARQARAFR